MRFKFKDGDTKYNVIPANELERGHCDGCIYESRNEGNGGSCRLSEHLRIKYDYDCDDHHAILIADPLLILKKL